MTQTAYQFKEDSILFKLKKGKWFVFAVLIIMAVYYLNPFVIIPAGHRGITMRLGAVQDRVRPEGVSLRIPMVDQVIKVDVRTKRVEWDAINSLTTVSKDLQDVFVQAVVTYHPDPEKIALNYRNIGLDYEDKKVKPLTVNSVKTHTAKYDVASILQSRETITLDVNNDLRKQLEKYNIVLEEISLTDIDFKPEYKQAIEQKQIAEKEVETQKFKLEKQALEAQQVVKEAEAKKQAKILEGEGIKEYNQSIAANLTPEILEFRKIENEERAINKWNGQYPSTVVGGETVPIIQIGKDGKTN